MENNNNKKAAVMVATTPKKTPRWFYLVSVLLPFVVLLLLELSLRVAGVAQRPALFVPAPGLKGYLTPNPDLIQRYVPNPAYAPQVAPDSWFFPAEKAPDTLRIVLQGESSAAGFPYGRFGSPAAMLQQSLKRLYPEKNIEVISVAMAAISSYTLLDTADEILAIQPDAVLIYAGHNEYLGVMGAGSSMAASSSVLWGRIILFLRQFNLFQWLQSVLSPLTEPEATQSGTMQQSGAVQHSGTMMSKAAAGQLIALDSELYQQGLAQFEQNISLLLATYQQAQIPVYIGTLASNEADQPPFQSEPELAFVPDPGSKSAEQELLLLLKQYPQHALLHFNYGIWLRQQGQTTAALTEFQLARDLDLLRFRAPSAFNTLIRRLAEQHQAVLVDIESKLRVHSKDQLLGQQLLLEHVHPNAQGYFLMAQAYLEQLIQSGLLPSPDIKWRQQNTTADMPLTRVDLLLAEHKIRQLKAFYPFSQHNNRQNKLPDFGPQPDKEHQLAYQRSQGLSWLDASQQLLEYYQKQQQVAEAAKVAGLLFDSLPDQHQAAYVAGQLYFAAEDLALAIYYQRRALALGKEPLSDRMALARSYFFAGKLSEAIELLKLDPQHQAAQQQLRRLSALQHQQRSK